MEKKANVDFLNGDITRILLRVSLPIVMTSFIQMAYNLVDMLWIGRLGSEAVTGVGVAGMYTWFADGLCTLAYIGGQVKIGHSLGAGDKDKAGSYFNATIRLGIFFAIAYTVCAFLFTDPLIAFYNLTSRQAISDAKVYLRLLSSGMIFYYLDMILTASFNVTGDSKTPFYINTAGMVLNILLDPALIFGVGPFPKMQVAGAAVASVISMLLIFVLLVIAGIRKSPLFRMFSFKGRISWPYYSAILKIGAPVALQNMLFSVISMFIARLISVYGDGAIAAQKVGSQIESITWMAADGFMSATNAFISNNYGAELYDRVRGGYRAIMKIVVIWGLACFALLFLFPGQIFSLFLNDPDVLPIGIHYLRIISFAQLFMCMEITTSGAFAGLGHTLPASVNGIVFTFARIPMAMLLSRTSLGLDGIWLSITISCVLKGVVLVIWYLSYQKRLLRLVGLQSSDGSLT